VNAQDWNAHYKPGTRVAMTRVDHSIVWTRTTAEARFWGGQDYIAVDAIQHGYVPLTWVEPLELPRET
jgi:hypothetical protein